MEPVEYRPQPSESFSDERSRRLYEDDFATATAQSLLPAARSPESGTAVGTPDSMRSSNDDMPETRNLRRRRRGLLQKIGTKIVFLAVLSILLLVAAVGVLTWIWFGNTEAEDWRLLLLGPYNTLFITITSVAIRFSIASLAWIATSMFASVLVERHGVRADKIAEASMARYTGSLFSLLFGGFGSRSWLGLLLSLQAIVAVSSQFTSTILFSDFRPVSFPGFATVASIKYNVIGGKTFEDQKSQRNRPTLEGTTELWLTLKDKLNLETALTPSRFEAFAEYSEPEGRLFRDDVDDTGPIWRAFLPFDVDGAVLGSRLQQYSGLTKIHDFRTICIRPNISNLSLANTAAVNPAAEQEPLWEGRAWLDLSEIPGMLPVFINRAETSPRPELTGFDPGEGDDVFDPELVGDLSSIDIEFKCGTADPNTSFVDTEAPVWEVCQTVIFFGKGILFGRVPSLDPAYYDIPGLITEQGKYSRNESDLPWKNTPAIAMESRIGNSYVVMDAKHDQRLRFSHVPNISAIENIPITSQMGVGPWAVLKGFIPKNETHSRNWDADDLAAAKDVPISTHITFCMEVSSPFVHAHPFLNITSNTASLVSTSEVGAVWDADSQHYKLGDVRRQLGATNASRLETPAQRGIFSIEPESFRRAIEGAVKTAPMSECSEYNIFGVPREDKDKLAFCGPCREDVADMTFRKSDPSYRATRQFWDDLFVQTLEETGSPALALQAVNTVQLREAYTSLRGSFAETEAAANVTGFVEARVPPVGGRKAGYFVVMTLIICQLALSVVALLLFRKDTRDAVLNNAWFVISQVAASPEVADVLALVGGGGQAVVTDDEVKRYIGSDERQSLLGDRGYQKMDLQRARFVVRDGAFRLRNWRGSDGRG